MKTVEPIFGSDAFNCPHCHAFAHQDWYASYAKACNGDPFLFDAGKLDAFRVEHRHDPSMTKVLAWVEKCALEKPFRHHTEGEYTSISVSLMHFSECFSCSGFAIWVNDNLVYPTRYIEVQPNNDMPASAAKDFIEAALIFSSSPRGATALLRLALQKMLIHLGQPGKNIDRDIGSLVAAGLPTQIQQALDVVRVIGNNAVHPGQIDIDDNKDIALKLFGLLNIITEVMITQPRQIREMFGSLPTGALEAIERRDKPKEIAPPPSDAP